MGLKLEVATLDDVPEAQRGLYREASGKYLLDADGLDDALGAKAKLSEFRNNNIKLMKDLEDAKKSHGLSADETAELKRLKDLEKDLKGKQTVSLAELEERVAERTSKLREEYTAKLTDAEKEAKQYLTAFERERVGNVLRSEAAKAGVLPEALDDVMYRGDRVFRLQDDQVTAFDSKNEIMYGRDGPLKVEEWFATLATTAKHLFAPNSGSGAEGSKKVSGRIDFDKMSSAERIAHGLREQGVKF